MNADADIQVWLQAGQHTQPQIIVPYVQSRQAHVMRYALETLSQALHGKSLLRQSGTVRLDAGKPAALGTIAITRSPNDECVVTLTLRSEDNTETLYRMNCPS